MSRNPVFVDAGRADLQLQLRQPATWQSLRGKRDRRRSGADLADQVWIHGGNPTDLYRTVTKGVLAKGMPTWGPVLGPEENHRGGGLRAELPQEGEPIIEDAANPGRAQSKRMQWTPRPASRPATSVTTIREDGSRRFLYPADVVGPVRPGAQGLLPLALIAVYLLLPWIKVGGYPAVFLDVARTGASTSSASPWPPRTSGFCSS